MTKLERAIKEAEELPAELREQLGDDLLQVVHKLLALREDIAVGVRALDSGDKIAGDVVFAQLKERYGA